MTRRKAAAKMIKRRILKTKTRSRLGRGKVTKESTVTGEGFWTRTARRSTRT